MTGDTTELEPESARPSPQPASTPLRRAPRPLPHDPELARILLLQVPVIVQLARRRMSIAQVRQLSVGAIIEFEKNVESELDLLVNDQQIGRGVCVKAGENFGLRITQVTDECQRIRSLGPKG